ncbi:protein ALP1-like [Agrilus planipennis]|uniref:Protein ALP1-like n=1 Tax=Agrilus planipennis TaxID=224129 RepID=A0A1W4XHY7_AGRPL|nr:protein ALP1-like [Agrilus planipennis]
MNLKVKSQIFFQCPANEEEWKRIAQNFEVKWNFPHCVGAIDGKHIVMQAPANSGSQYYNYKHTFSIVLMAVVDANYNFIYAHVGCQGRISDGGVFKNTEFYKLLNKNKLNLPSPVELQGRSIKSPFIFVGDEAFPLRTDLLKPYSGQLGRSPERIFNYRLSRARRISENAFGILSASFRIFRKPINLNIENTQAVTTACIYLYNFMRKKPSSGLLSFGSVDVDDPMTGNVSQGKWRVMSENDKGMVNLPRRPIRPSQAAWDVREEFKNYFMTPEGRIEWQESYA